jgi:hypothetical protein
MHGADALEEARTGSAGRPTGRNISTPGHNPNDLETVSGAEGALGELRRSHGVSIVLHDHTSREQPPTHQELLDRARELGRHGFAIGDHGHPQSVVGRPRK